MKNRILFVLLLGLCLPISIFAQTAEPLFKDAFIENAAASLPQTICNPSGWYSQCFNVIQAECRENVISAFKVCINKYKKDIPDMLNTYEEGYYWGEIIGNCTGKTYITMLGEKRIRNEKCDNPAKWF